VGDPVAVFSKNAWIDDGVIMEISTTIEVFQTLTLLPGSIKVQYEGEKKLKWIPESHVSQYLKRSNRPPTPKTLKGELLKESWGEDEVQWNTRFLQLKKGWLQWWDSKEEAASGEKPHQSFALVGLALGSAGTVLSLRAQTTKGTVYNFDTRQHQDPAKTLQDWMQSLREHAEFIDAMKKAKRAK